MTQIDLAYPGILDSIKSSRVPRRTDSHAFLLWFLLHYYRLDETAARDVVSDGPDDKGIHGIYVDDNLETVDVFQCRLVQNPRRTLRDAQLKELVGTLGQFGHPRTIRELASGTSNAELSPRPLSAPFGGGSVNHSVVRSIRLEKAA